MKFLALTPLHKACCDSTMKWLVTFTVFKRDGSSSSHKAGPYAREDEAERHRAEIAGYAFVRDCRVVPVDG